MTSAAWRRRLTAAAGIAVLALAVSSCAPEDEDDAGSSGGEPQPQATDTSGSETAAADPCAVDQLPLQEPGTLTIATDKPAYEPWFQDNDPTNGKGYESAVAYAVAEQLGFARSDVTWVVEPFNKSYAPGDKAYDFDINQISITPQRAEVVDFSDGYYQAAQAVIVPTNSEYANTTSISELQEAKFGAQVGTTSLQAIESVIAPSQDVAVFDDTNGAKQALLNGQIDAFVADLPTAFYITAVEIPQATISGQFQPTTGEIEEFGLLFEKGNPLVDCVNQALGELRDSGELDEIEQRWLSQVVDVPELS
jgi:polar amino acid transport system substrate-binding protein